MLKTTEGFYDISNEELKNFIKEKPYQFVDVRTFPEYNDRRIREFNINIDYYQMIYDLSMLHHLSKEIPIVVMCAHGVRSRVVANLLIQMGHKDIYNLRNGIALWDGELV